MALNNMCFLKMLAMYPEEYLWRQVASLIQRQQLIKVIAEMSGLRQENDALAYGETKVLYSDDNVIVYERKFYDDVVVVAVNRQPDREYQLNNVTTDLSDSVYNDELSGILYDEWRNRGRRAAVFANVLLS